MWRFLVARACLLVVLVLQTMLAIRVFDLVYVLTAGGPGTSTTTLVWQTYLTTFDSLDFGLVGCRRAVPHLQRLLGHLETALKDLERGVGL